LGQENSYPLLASPVRMANERGGHVLSINPLRVFGARMGGGCVGGCEIQNPINPPTWGGGGNILKGAEMLIKPKESSFSIILVMLECEQSSFGYNVKNTFNGSPPRTLG